MKALYRHLWMPLLLVSPLILSAERLDSSSTTARLPVFAAAQPPKNLIAPARTTHHAALLAPPVVVDTPAASSVSNPHNHRFNEVCVVFSSRVSPSLRASVYHHLERVPGLTVWQDVNHCRRNEQSVLLALGSTPFTRQLIAPSAAAQLADEGFILRFGNRGQTNVIAIDSADQTSDAPDIGLAFGLFAALEKLGFAFLHPLSPVVPNQLILNPARFNTTQSPRWPIRGIHLHTMHPIELTNLLNGWGLEGPEDGQGFVVMLDDWRHFLEWMLANRLNRVQWVLLWSVKWRSFAESDERFERLARLVEMAHDYGIQVGIDTPINFRQQNAYRLLRATGDLQDELNQLRNRIDRVMEAGFDYLATENGTSEFTHSDPERTLVWMNAIVRHLDQAHSGKRAYMKVHVSSGQATSRFTDPVTGGPLNVNFLPYYADRRLAVMPHTVEYYGLNDPAPTYGNTDFSHIEKYMMLEAGRREVVYFPETAYWCSFDIDVPLFLPIYAKRRFDDLRKIAQMERQKHTPAKTKRPSTATERRIDGQIIFSSGWEWGYWLGDVIAARTSWDPRLDRQHGDDLAFSTLLEELFHAFGESARPVASLVAHTAERQAELLIKGANHEGSSRRWFDPRLTGQAYLQGVDSLDDLAERLPNIHGISLTPTQPQRSALLLDPFDNRREALGDLGAIEQLLEVIEQEFTAIGQSFARWQAVVPQGSAWLVDDLTDAAQITAWRAIQIRALFGYAIGRRASYDRDLLNRYDERARWAMSEALRVVSSREALYRTDPNRIASWKNNPTAYRFGYLWTVHTLHYWRRDHQRIVGQRTDPCLLNIVDPLELAFGVDSATPPVSGLHYLLSQLPGLNKLSNCFTKLAPLVPPHRLADRVLQSTDLENSPR